MRLSNFIKQALANILENWSKSYVLRGKLDAAIKAATMALQLNPDLVSAYVNRGIAFDKNGNYEAAINDYTYALKLEPHLAQAYFQRGATYYHNAEYADAIADLNMAIHHKPIARHFAYRAFVNEAMDNYQAAISDYSQAIHLSPKDAEIYRWRGDAYAHNREFKAAKSDYQHHLTLSRRHREEILQKINGLPLK